MKRKRSGQTVSMRVSRRLSSRLKTSPIHKTGSSKLRGSNPSEDHLETIVAVEEPEDKYSEFRYLDNFQQAWPPFEPDYRMRTVLVRRVLPGKETADNTDPTSQGLTLPTMSQQEALRVYSPASSLLHQKTQAIHMEVEREQSVQEGRRRALVAQEASLKTWGKALRSWDSVRDHVSDALGKPQDSLLLSRPLVLPRVQSQQCCQSYGPESDFPQWRQKERFYNKDAFFLLPEHLGPEEDGLFSSLTWSHRQLYKPPLTIVQPAVEEQPAFRDPTGRTMQVSETEQQMKQLTLMGHRLLKADQKTIPRLLEEVNDDRTADIPDWSFPPSPASERSVSKLEESCSFRLESPYYVRKTVPAFQLDRFTFVWGQPSLQDMVEIGVVSQAGERGQTHIQLANVGSCLMRYSWRRLPHQDHFHTGRYRLSPFVFNYGDGSLLPEEKLSIPVQFYSRYAGRWTEQWMLRTTPCVYEGPGGAEEIAVSLWGQALEVDVHLTLRQQLESELANSAMHRLAERYTYDLVRLLPLRTVQQQQDVQQQLRMQSGWEEDPVQVFHRLNPKLYYHSPPVTLLLTAQCQLLIERRGLAIVRAVTEQIEDTSRGAVSAADKAGPPSRASVAGSIAPDRAPRRPDRVSRSRKSSNNQTTSNGSSTPVPPRQRSMSRSKRKPSVLQYPGMPQSFSTEDLRQFRRQLEVGRVYREAQALSEDCDKKEETLRIVSQAVLDMSQRPLASPIRHYKHVLLRAALVQLCDRLAALEWTLRRDLHLLDDPRFTRLASFSPDGSGTRKRSSVREVSRSGSLGSRKMSVRSRPSLAQPVKPVNWEEAVARQYHVKLTAMVHRLLTSTLQALLPVLTYDGYRMDPLLPPPEI